jgi:hypothetical protein
MTLATLMIEAMCSSETSGIGRATRRNISEDGILHNHRCEYLKSYLILIGCALKRRRNVFPVSNELGFYVPEDGIVLSHRRVNLKSYIA